MMQHFPVQYTQACPSPRPSCQEALSHLFRCGSSCQKPATHLYLRDWMTTQVVPALPSEPGSRGGPLRAVGNSSPGSTLDGLKRAGYLTSPMHGSPVKSGPASFCKTGFHTLPQRPHLPKEASRLACYPQEKKKKPFQGYPVASLLLLIPLLLIISGDASACLLPIKV